VCEPAVLHAFFVATHVGVAQPSIPSLPGDPADTLQTRSRPAPSADKPIQDGLAWVRGWPAALRSDVIRPTTPPAYLLLHGTAWTVLPTIVDRTTLTVPPTWCLPRSTQLPSSTPWPSAPPERRTWHPWTRCIHGRQCCSASRTAAHMYNTRQFDPRSFSDGKKDVLT